MAQQHLQSRPKKADTMRIYAGDARRMNTGKKQDTEQLIRELNSFFKRNNIRHRVKGRI